MKMRLKNVAVLVAVSVCLTATAWGAVWDGSDGLLWSNGNNWTPAGVPLNEAAIINNGLLGSPTLNVVSNITNLEVSGFSTLNINAGADLTATGGGSIAGGGFDEGYVNHTGGDVSFGADLFVANGGADFGRWTMMADATLAVANDLAVGGSGDALFELSDDGILNVGGSIGIGSLAGGSGTMVVSGGTVTETGGGLSIGSGVLQVEGDTPVINVTDYEQAGTGGLNLVLGNAGIAPINISGDMILNGGLNVSVAGGASPAPDTYDILVADGTRTGIFNSVNLPENVTFGYVEEGGKSIARLYVGVDGPVVEGAKPNAISVNTDWGIATQLGSGDIAGVEKASNWNNVDASGGEVVMLAGELNENSGAATQVTMKLNGAAAGSELNFSGVGGDYNMMDNGPRSILNGVASNDLMQLELTGLAEQFPNGYDVILYFGTGINNPWGHENVQGGWGVTVVTTPGTYSADMTDTPFMPGQIPQNTPSGSNIVSTHGWMENKHGDDGAPYTFANIYRESTDSSVPGNYQVISGQAMDTLTLTFQTSFGSSRGTYPATGDPSDYCSYSLLGFQIIGSLAQSIEMVVDNLDPEFTQYEPNGDPFVYTFPDSSNTWRERSTSDEWDGRSQWTNTTGAYAIWGTPLLPFEEATEYEVFVWFSAEKPDGTGYYGTDQFAEYTVVYSDGLGGLLSEVFVINQDIDEDSGRWIQLGEQEDGSFRTFLFTGERTEEGDPIEYVKLMRTDQAFGGVTSADAVMWRWVAPEAPAVEVIPEPAGLGLIGLALLAARRRRN